MAYALLMRRRCIQESESVGVWPVRVVSEPRAVATGSRTQCFHVRLVSERGCEYDQLKTVEQLIRSHPPPHAGCPRGDPAPLAVLTRSRFQRYWFQSKDENVSCQSNQFPKVITQS